MDLIEIYHADLPIGGITVDDDNNIYFIYMYYPNNNSNINILRNGRTEHDLFLNISDSNPKNRHFNEIIWFPP